jgi:RHH-type transcriptional regulator, rel operon repressor / antitoxin RelB
MIVSHGEYLPALKSALICAHLRFTHIPRHSLMVLRLDPALESRLERLARKAGRTKTSCVREALVEYLDDLEDIHLAKRRLQRPAKTFSAEDVKHQLPF